MKVKPRVKEPVALKSVTLTNLPDGVRIFSADNASAYQLTLMSETNCLADTDYVEYTLDGNPVGRSYAEPYLVTYSTLSELTAGLHTITTTAVGLGGGQDTATSTIQFVLLTSDENMDVDANALPRRSLCRAPRPARHLDVHRGRSRYQSHLYPASDHVGSQRQGGRPADYRGHGQPV